MTAPATFDPTTLTDEQLDGESCVTCGAEFELDSRSVPVGTFGGAQVFACVSHAAAATAP